MAFSSLSEFIAMGGYSFYVWLAYGISLLSVIFLVFNSMQKRKQIFKKVEQRVQRDIRIKAAKKQEGTL